MRLYWVGLYEERRGRNWERFFQVDLAPIFGYAPKHLVRKSEHTYSMPCGSRGACIDANRHAVVLSLSRLGEMLPSPEIIFACVSPVIGVLITYLGSLVLMYPPILKFFLQLPDWLPIACILFCCIFLVGIIGMVVVVGSIISVAIVFTRRWCF